MSPKRRSQCQALRFLGLAPGLVALTVLLPPRVARSTPAASPANPASISAASADWWSQESAILTSAWTGESNQTAAGFGGSVCTAGDVNGDGFSDLIVGADRFDNGQADEGRAFVFHGSPDGLNTFPAWTSESNQATAAWGRAVGAAGDVNGDGYDDVIVGAPLYDNGHTDEGRAAVFLGSPAGLAASPAWIVESNQAGAGFGGSVAGAGDVNDDGYADVVVGAPLWDIMPVHGQEDAGRVFVYHGSATGLSTTPARQLASTQPLAMFGASVATAGDVNADGYADIVAGAPQYSNGQTAEGRAFVYHGSPTGVPASPAWTGESNQAASLYGVSVSTTGDVNGDGFADVVVGAPHYDLAENTDFGWAFVYYGSATGLQGSGASLFLHPVVQEPEAEFGCSVATAGDVNGDGYADLIVGERLFGELGPQIDQGQVYLFLGSATGVERHSWSATSGQALAFFGTSVATAGDVNGDGFSDVVVGAPGYGNGQADEGRAFVYHGAAEDPSTTAAWTAESNQASAFFGHWVGTAGDVNGDGYSDAIVAAWSFDNGQTDEGRAYVYHGSSNGLLASPWTAESNEQASYIWSAATAGDVNGDGYSDVIVGYPEYGPFAEGRAVVYHGSPTGLGASPAWDVSANVVGALFGYAVATAGDVNGDGYSDIIVGAYGFSNGQNSEGRAFVYHGSPSGLSTTPAWTAESNQFLAEFGYSVSTAGDVNGDGFSDVIVGAFGWDNPEVNEGEAVVYHGSASGLSASPAWQVESNQSPANFGTMVATAGDVNGDGYSDVLVGANHFSNGETWEGRAFLYLGSPGGLFPTANWTAESNQANGFFGNALGTAGDVNGDGYSDVIIGAYGYDNDQLSEGRAWIYYGSPGSILTGPAWIGESNQELAHFGWSTATAGDVNGDGFSDVIIGAQDYSNGQDDEGRAYVYYGGKNDGLDRRPRQGRVHSAAPIALLGISDSNSSFTLKVLGRTPAGRGDVRLEYEVKPHDVAFDGNGLVLGQVADTGVPGGGGSAIELSEIAGGLDDGALYHWRLRVVTDSPFFPHTRWLSLPYNGATEADVRTSQTTGVAESQSPAPTGRWLEAGAPNPFAAATELAYTLPHAAEHRLAVYDVHGRQVALLAKGMERAGRHIARWNGTDPQGHRLPAGVYFLRLTIGDRVESQKLVLSR
jgi:FG-GAP-like repeat/FG-GAP repeat/FlgD Ig-like domain